MPANYNTKHIGVRRIRQEIKELQADKSILYRAMASEENIFNWHFVIRGPPDSDFEGGVYCGRIQLPPDYPYKPPHIILDTPNGRFRQGERICLSISAYHPEKWHPAWGVRTILEALISFFPTPGEGAVAALDWPKKDRQLLAKRSHEFNLKNNLYKTVEPLQPATKEEILSAQQNFCEEAKNTAAMSSYHPGAGKTSEAKDNGQSRDQKGAAATSAAMPNSASSSNTSKDPIDNGQPSSKVRKRSSVSLKPTHNEKISGKRQQSNKQSNNQQKPCNGMLTFITCILLILLLILLLRRFNRSRMI